MMWRGWRGAITGGMIRRVIGFLIGIGPVSGSGIIIATRAGAGRGAAAGGMVGALTVQGGGGVSDARASGADPADGPRRQR